MQSFSEWAPANDPCFRERSLIAFDLDDTLTEEGALSSEVVAGLEAVQKQGWTTLLVTGRPAGWADALIKLMPFDAIVAENGALLFFWPERKAQRQPRTECVKAYWSPQGYVSRPPTGLQSRFEEAKKKILTAVPGSRVASDQSYRLYDLAIDFAEEVEPPLSLNEAEKIRALFESLGAVAKVSSIHVNGWWGAFSKLDGLREIVEVHWKKSIAKNLVYVGDSPNDGPLFASEALSIGVANVQAFIGKTQFQPPRFVTREKSGRGSLEILKSVCLRPAP